MSESINHIGSVERIEGEKILVRVTQHSACSGCHAKGLCSMSEQKDKLIEVPACGERFSVGEQVMVCGRASLGLQAVLLAFVLPIVVVVAGIALGESEGWSETASGLAGLALLVPYYGVLYMACDILKKKFTFTLKKLN